MEFHPGMPYQGRGIHLQNLPLVASPSEILVSPINRCSRNLAHLQLPDLAIYLRPAHGGHEFSQRDHPHLTSLAIDDRDTLNSMPQGEIVRTPLRCPLQLDAFDYNRLSHRPLSFKSEVIVPSQYRSLGMFGTFFHTSKMLASMD